MAQTGLRWGGTTSTLLLFAVILAFMTKKAHAFGAGNIPSIGTFNLTTCHAHSDSY